MTWSRADEDRDMASLENNGLGHVKIGQTENRTGSCNGRTDASPGEGMNRTGAGTDSARTAE